MVVSLLCCALGVCSGGAVDVSVALFCAVAILFVCVCAPFSSVYILLCFVFNASEEEKINWYYLIGTHGMHSVTVQCTHK